MDEANALLGMVRERFRNQVIGAFTIALCLQNWKALYVLFRSHGKPAAVMQSVVHHWNGWWESAAVALFVAFVAYPLLQTLSVIHEAWVAKCQYNRVKRFQAGHLKTLAELEEHSDYKRLKVEVDALKDHIQYAWRLITGTSTALTSVYTTKELMLAPAFGKVSTKQAYYIGPIDRKVDGRDVLAFVFKTINDRIVVAGIDGAIVPWPEASDDVQMFAAEGNESVPYAQVLDPQLLAKKGVRIVLRRAPEGHTDAWGKVQRVGS